MRGKVASQSGRTMDTRITPAYAGKSLTLSAKPLTSQDHPRVCGEKDIDRHSVSADVGSPPRMRGKGVQQLNDAGHAGITPAYAGKSFPRPCPRKGTRDHPRVCGEKYSEGVLGGFSKGSPPRMRGKASATRRNPASQGITPAYAGKS